MTPTEFEHLTKQLFEARGMKSWVTQASKDDGVDAVAVNEDPMTGGLCIISMIASRPCFSPPGATSPEEYHTASSA